MVCSYVNLSSSSRLSMKLSWFGTSSPAAEPLAETNPSTDALRSVDKDVDEGGEQEVDSVSQVLRKTDVWFAYRIHELENQAKELAASHAAIGQPRHDQEHPGPLEVEVLLAKRGTEIILNWADRIRIKILGAMEREIE